MVDVVNEAGLPVESNVDEDNQQAYLLPVNSLKRLWNMESPGGRFRMFLVDTLSTTVLMRYPPSRISLNTANSNQRLTGRAFTRYVTSERV